MIDPSRFLMSCCVFSIFCENAKSHTGAFSCFDYIPFGAFWQLSRIAARKKALASKKKSCA
jgi:hypothetical protein